MILERRVIGSVVERGGGAGAAPRDDEAELTVTSDGDSVDANDDRARSFGADTLVTRPPVDLKRAAVRSVEESATNKV